MILFNDEQILKAYAKDIEDNKEKETERKIAERLIKKGEMTLEEICTSISAVLHFGYRGLLRQQHRDNK